MPFVAPTPPAGIAETVAALIAYCEMLEASVPGGVNGANVIVAPTDGGLSAAQSGAFVRNLGAVGSSTQQLPPATPNMDFLFYCDVAQTFAADAQAGDVIAMGSLTSISGGTISANLVGSMFRLHCFTSGVWVVTNAIGDLQLQTS